MPVNDVALQARLEEILAVNLAHDALAWVLESSGRWRKLAADDISSQRRFQELAVSRAQRQAEPVA